MLILLDQFGWRAAAATNEPLAGNVRNRTVNLGSGQAEPANASLLLHFSTS